LNADIATLERKVAMMEVAAGQHRCQISEKEKLMESMSENAVELERTNKILRDQISCQAELD